MGLRLQFVLSDVHSGHQQLHQLEGDDYAKLHMVCLSSWKPNPKDSNNVSGWNRNQSGWSRSPTAQVFVKTHCICNVFLGSFVDKMSTYVMYTIFQLSTWPGCLFLFAETLSIRVSASDLGSLKVPPASIHLPLTFSICYIAWCRIHPGPES